MKGSILHIFNNQNVFIEYIITDNHNR